MSAAVEACHQVGTHWDVACMVVGVAFAIAWALKS